LVVIAIIAILAVLLSPVIGSAMESSQKAKCTSNLRQIEIAVRLYANDHGGKIINLRVLPGGGGDYWPSILSRAGLMPAADMPIGQFHPAYSRPTTGKLVKPEDRKISWVPWKYRMNLRLAVVQLDPSASQVSFLALQFPARTSLAVDGPTAIGTQGVAPWYPKPSDILTAGIYRGKMNVLFWRWSCGGDRAAEECQ
jgi:hypothetical protein